jgi:hypothetical protein
MKLEQKLYAILSSSAEVIAKVATLPDGKKNIHIGQHAPVGAVYPQITFSFEEAISEEVLPAKRGVLYIRYYLDENATQPFSSCTEMCDIIESLINKRPQACEDVSYGSNVGLHVNRCVKTARTTSAYIQEIKKYCAYLSFDIVMSDEFMDFNSENGDEIAWP